MRAALRLGLSCHGRLLLVLFVSAKYGATSEEQRIATLCKYEWSYEVRARGRATHR